MTNTLKMTGLKKASGETKDLTGAHGEYLQISYDTGTGQILTDYHVSLGQNSWSQYHDRNIITVCNATRPMKMEEIAQAIEDRIALLTY